MKLLQTTIDAIIADGLQRYPLEACGYIVNTKGVEETIALSNLAGEKYGEKMFIMDQTTALTIRQTSEILAIYHTHPHSSPAPSIEDLVGCKKSGIDWFILNPHSGEYNYISPSEITYNIPLLGRKFAWGIFDCYALLQDYYREILKIELKDFDRGLLFEWNSGDWNRFEENFESAGFRELGSREKLKAGDVFLMNIGSDKINHCGVLAEPNRNVFYHHLLDRKSEGAVYGGWYKQVTRKTVRYVPPVIPEVPLIFTP